MVDSEASSPSRWRESMGNVSKGVCIVGNRVEIWLHLRVGFVGFKYVVVDYAKIFVDFETLYRRKKL